MTLEQILKAQGYTDEQIATIKTEMANNKLYTTNEENIDIRYSKLKTERDDLKNKLETADATIADLKVANKDNEALQATIQAHEDTINAMKEEYTTKLRDMSIQSAIQSKLTDTKYPELLETKFDKTKLTVSEDGSVFGIDEQMAGIKEMYADLFTPVVKGRNPNNTVVQTAGTKNPWSKEHFNLTEQARLLREEPDLAQQLKSSK